MPRPSLLTDKRRELLPTIARAFTDLGYRRATTGELARRCGVQETILYRLWPDKKAMFLAAIDYVYEFSERSWLRLLEQHPDDASAARRLLEYESEHHGEFGHYRILFAGLVEADDPDIRVSLRRVFSRFHRFLMMHVLSHRRGRRSTHGLSADLAAWAAIGLGTVANIARELDLLGDADRRRLFTAVGAAILEEESA